MLIAAIALAGTGGGRVQGQRIHAFVSAGATLSQIEGDELKGFSQGGLTGGVGAITHFDRRQIWNLSIETLFSQRGAYNNTGDPYSLDLRMNYVDIPLMVHFRDPWGGMLVGAGLKYSRLLEQPTGRLKYNPQYFFPDTTDMDFLRNDLAAIVDIRFPVWRNLLLNIQWQYSLLAVKRDWLFHESDGTTPVLDEQGDPVTNPDGSTQTVTRWKTWTNNCYSNSIIFRLIWQF